MNFIWLGSVRARINLAIVAVIVHSVLLFVLIPAVSNHVRPFYNQNQDIDGYDQIATNLVEGNGYRFYPDTAKTLMREPGYPVFLATLYRAFGVTFTPVKLANMLLALATAWMMMRFARRIWTNSYIAIVPSLLFLFDPGIDRRKPRSGRDTVRLPAHVAYFAYCQID